MTNSEGVPLSVRIAPRQPEELVRIIEACGIEVSQDPRDSEVLVWTASSPEGIDSELSETVRWVQLPAAGIERWIDGGVIDDQRVWSSAAGVYAEHVAERAVAGLLATSHGFLRYARQHAWARHDYRPMTDRTVAVIGTGGIGRAVCCKVAALGSTVIAVNRTGDGVPGATRTVALREVAQLWAEVDDVVLCLPATAETSGLVDEKVLRALPADGSIVNVGRGECMDTGALVRVLAGGHLNGAVLDVVDPEPLPEEHPLWRESRALVTCHSANPESLRWPALARRVLENLRRISEGSQPHAVIDPSRGY